MEEEVRLSLYNIMPFDHPFVKGKRGESFAVVVPFLKDLIPLFNYCMISDSGYGSYSLTKYPYRDLFNNDYYIFDDFNEIFEKKKGIPIKRKIKRGYYNLEFTIYIYNINIKELTK